MRIAHNGKAADKARRGTTELSLAAILLILTLFAIPSLAGAAPGSASADDEYSEVERLSAAEPNGFRGFGIDLAVQGEWLVVGARNDRRIGFDGGAAYVFHREGDSWRQTQTLEPIQRYNDRRLYFGRAVALDGDTLAVSAPGDVFGEIQPGVVYTYRLEANQWIQVGRFTASGAEASDSFGTELALEGDTLLVGRSRYVDFATNIGFVDVFERRNGEWVETQVLTERPIYRVETYGGQIALRGDLMVVRGGPPDWWTSVAYVYRRRDGIWQVDATLRSPNSSIGFGQAVAIEGETIYVSVPGEGNPPFRVPGLGGTVYAFEKRNGSWIQTEALRGSMVERGDQFGTVISIDGATMIITAGSVFPPGAIYLYGLRGRAWEERTILVSNEPPDSQGFGATTAIEGDTLFLGNPRQNDGTGALYVFEPVASEVILGLGHQRATAGSASELVITVDSRSADVSAFRFSTRFPPEVPLDGRAGSKLLDVKCNLERDLREDFDLHSLVDADSGTLSIELSSTASPPKALPRDGRIGGCQVPVGIDASEGVWPILCADGSSATDPEGIGLATRCEEGQVTLFPFACTADCNEDGTVSIDELVMALQIGLRRYAPETCAASDIDRDGAVSVNELVSAVGYAIEGCPNVP